MGLRHGAMPAKNLFSLDEVHSCPDSGIASEDQVHALAIATFRNAASRGCLTPISAAILILIGFGEEARSSTPWGKDHMLELLVFRDDE
jgi:hypothetical protein